MDQDFSGKSRVLVAPLDWGLGHATRCIPLIRQLMRKGAEVFLAGEGAQEVLLKTEFPDLPFLPLKGYRVQYSRSAAGLPFQMIRQAPMITKAIRTENEWLQQKAGELQLDSVISDNRYGLHHPRLNSIFVTHQLMIKTGLGKWTERILQQRNYSYINRFNSCWVPDVKSANNLAGDLSHPQKMPSIPVKYTGPLSRFELHGPVEKEQHLLILLSGPEPQRSIFEEIILPQLSNYTGSVTLVRGLPAALNVIPSAGNLRFFNHLPSAELNREIESASFVIARGGYSTIMDLACLKKKAVLVPTPGQTEQEYLVKHLASKNIFAWMPQKKFSIQEAKLLAENFKYEMYTNDDGAVLNFS